MLNMTFDELGTGDTTSWPDAPGGYFPFTGSISSLIITSGVFSPLAGTVALTGPASAVGGFGATGGAGGFGFGTAPGPSQITFTPPDTGPYTIGLSATDLHGLTGVQTATLSPTEVTATLSVPGTASAVQGQRFYLGGTFTDAAGDGPWTITVNFGDGSPTAFAGSGPTGPTSFSFSTGAHRYANAGLFNAQVTFTNADGQTRSATVPVSVSGFTVNDGSPQQSMVRSLTYTFPDPTQVEPGAFVLLRNGKPSDVKLVITPLADGMTYVITFAGPGVVGGSVPDGNYTLITLHDKVDVLSGPPMTQDDVNTFVRLFGDVDGDGVVSAADKALLKQAETDPGSSSAWYFDYNGNGVLDKADSAQFTRRYGDRLDPPSRAPARFPGQKAPHPLVGQHTLVTLHRRA
jgi:hypothetical protein